MYMKAKEIMSKYGICRVTLWRWIKEKKINYVILPSGRYDYLDMNTTPNDFKRKTVLYTRCYIISQKDILNKQINRLKQFASANGYIIDEVYSEIASVLNYNRKQYRKLFKEIISGNIERIIIEYKDRLLRIGFDDFKELCNIFKVDLIVIDNSENQEQKQEIKEDLISIINDFSSNIYSNNKIEKINTLLNEEE